MKVKILLLILLASFFSLFAFAAQLNDAQILQTLIVLNTNEIDAANVALKTSSNANVKQFAQAMVRDHSKNRQEARRLAATLKLNPRVSVNSVNLQMQGKKLLIKLKALSGKDFDQDYMNAMVKDHEDALALIDKDLLPSTSNPQIIKYLKATRNAVAKHLQMAKEIQKQLG